MFEHHKKESPIISLAGMGGGAASYIFYSAAGGGAEEISRSVKLSNDSYLRRTPSSSGNRKTWTLSFWAKFCGGAGHILSANNDGFQVELRSDGRLLMKNDGCFSNTYSTHEYRDYAAWYHFVFEHDAANTYFKIHVNGELHQTITATNANGTFNHNNVHGWNGRSTSNDSLFDFYLANVEFVDGSALAPTNFGEYDSYNVWQPKAYGGSYGTNGYKLAFSDTSSYTSVGNDSAGSNNWTPTNLKAKDYDYASDITFYSASSLPFNNQHRIFDGTADSDATISSGECWVEFTPTTPIPYTSSVEVMGSGSPSNPYNLRWILNEGTPVNGVNANSYVSLASGSGTITKIRGQVDTGGFNWRAIRVDGVILSDSTASIDVVRDSPSNITADSGNNIGNYCTLNPLDRQASNGELANGNLGLRQTSGAWAMYRGTMSMSSGKWYWEVTFGNDQYSMIGIIPTDYLMSSNSNYWPAQVPNGYVFYPYTGNKYDNTSSSSYASADTSGTGDVYGIALDLDAGTMTYYKNGSSLGTAHTGISGSFAPVAALYNQSNFDEYNFGQLPFKYTPPANHLSICSKNLNPPVADSTTGFKALAYDGDGNATREITGMGHSPDFLWITQTSAGGWQHVLYDRTRGPGTSSVTKSLSTNSNRTEASGNDTNHGFVSAFGTDGFTVDKGSQSGGSYTNHLNWNYLAYSWDAGESAVTYGPSGSGADNESSNYDILTTVRANTTTGVSVLSYTGSGNNQDKIAHGLGATPEAWILKSRTGAKEWYLYTQVYDGTVDFITINGNQGKNDSQSNSPNATSISLYGSTVNSTDDYAGYAFRSVEGFSKIGFYTGSGNQQFIPLGFTPAWVMIKRFTDNTVGQWTIYDTANSPTNEVTKKIWADAAGGEEDHTNNSIDIVSNGFVLDPGSDSGNVAYTNTGSVGYFYMAFAEHPLTTARAR